MRGHTTQSLLIPLSPPPPPPPYPLTLRARARSIITPCATNLHLRLRSDDELFVDFIAALLSMDPDRRPTAAQALQHPWLRHAYPAEQPLSSSEAREDGGDEG